MRPTLKSCDGGRLRLLTEDLLTPEETTWLEEHVERCARCRERLDQLVGEDRWLDAVRRYLGSDETSSHAPGPDAAGSLEFLAPSDWPDSMGRLGTYEVIGVLGRGGMGVVLKAFDPALNRNIAIKVLSAALASCGAARRRFLREARAAAAVVHEHVVSVFAVEEIAGLPILVMEYVPGRSLQDRLDKTGPLTLPEILRIGMQTASGLAAAHAQGLVHRDVKPANILLEKGVERVWLSDFGLARAAADAAVTQSGVIAGTPHYMAPEQARGETSDHRSDLFSLGSTLYTMCAGHPPFRAESPLAVLRRVSDDHPRPLREINPEVPEWLEAIIAKLHAKDPSERYPTASLVAELLGRCLAHVQQPLSVSLPTEMLPSATRHRTRRGSRRNSAVALCVLVAVGGAALATDLWGSRGTSAPKEEILPAIPPPLRSSSLTAPSPNPADEIAQQIEEAHRRLSALEADLRRPRGMIEADSISVRTLQLADQASVLEQQIVAGMEKTGATPNRSPYSQPR